MSMELVQLGALPARHEIDPGVECSEHPSQRPDAGRPDSAVLEARERRRRDAGLDRKL
jgi:hypothetical protein